jgi:hypothetical protein
VQTDGFPPNTPPDELQFFSQTGNKNATIYAIAKLPAMKTLEKTLKLPENTPEDMRTVFNSRYKT